MRSWRNLMAGALAVGMMAVPVDAIARQAELKPTLVLTIRPLTVDGSPGRPSSLERSAPEVTGTTYLMAGRRDLPDNQLCYTRATSGEVSRPEYLEKALAEASYVWTMKTTALKYETGRHSFEIDWQRFDRGSQTAAASGKQQLTLADGETYLLDFLRGSSEAPCRTPAIAIEVTSGVREDPALADTILRYDLWLVRQHPSKGKETSHVIVTAAQGASVDFAFPTLRTDVPEVQPDQYDLNVATRVKGTLRGRLTRDGRVSLELATESSNNVERRAAAPPSGLRPRTGAGRKVLTLGLAETIQIELPQSTGYASVFGSEAAERAFKEQVSKGAGASTGTKPPNDVPVALHDGRLVVNYGPLFGGTKVSLILQVRVARDAEDPPVARR